MNILNAKEKKKEASVAVVKMEGKTKCRGGGGARNIKLTIFGISR